VGLSTLAKEVSGELSSGECNYPGALFAASILFGRWELVGVWIQPAAFVVSGLIET
jgi:hypothetical protein